ncbi:BtrH N-terminal domain-containing protein [Metabacillus fastidiosus]|uniref:BtrH N-terminal domain-containing protein n=1 Tax=Metabacillus fastidiosus TaxID=1458 RepID=UPI003D2CB2FC
MKNKLIINYSRNFDCYTLTINAVLSRIVKEVDLLWSQAGMLSYENENNIFFTPYYRDVKENLKKIANIETITEDYDKFSEFSSNLKNTLINDYTAMISVDVFNLPFNLYFQKKHSVHFIEVVGFNNEGFLICDHFYKYTGVVQYEVINQAMSSLIKDKFENDYSFTYFNTKKLQLKDNDTFLQDILFTNTSVILGYKPFELENINNKTITVGLQSFTNFIEYLDNEIFVKGINFQQIYRNLFNFSNSRFHYSMIIKSLGKESPRLENIKEGYEEISQLAKITANLILKTSVTKDLESNYAPILNNLDSIRNSEEMLANNINEKWGFLL